MTKYKLMFLFFALSIMIILNGVSCSRSTEPSAKEKTEITRIISAAPSNTEILVALGLGDRLIAVDQYSGDIQGVPAGLPLIDFFHPDVEAVIGLNPDLIIANEINSFGVADNPFRMLGDLGITVIDVPTSTSIEGIYNDIIMIAEALGVKERGEAIVRSMRDEIEKIAAAGNAMPEKKKVFFEISSEPTLYSLGQGTFLNEMIEIAGGINIFAEQRGWISLSAEEVIMRDPDVIFTFAYYPGHDPVTEIKNRSAFQSISAVRLNQVYAVDTNSASRPSQNILKALTDMARAINP